MDQSCPSLPECDTSVQWAIDMGIKIGSVRPSRTPERGLGIVARHGIKAGEELIHVPFSALVTMDSVPEVLYSSLRGISVHGLLASFFASHRSKESMCSSWMASWPTRQDFQDSMPLLWPDLLREPLHGGGLPFYHTGLDESPSNIFPPSVSGRWTHSSMQGFRETNRRSLLAQQKQNLWRDWAIVSNNFPEESLADYTYYWLIVNTRSFYLELPTSSASQSRSDCMVLCPFVDYFNHADHGCAVAFDGKGFTVTSDRVYSAGDELFVTYGAHSNDFLFVEYGFIPERNKFDSLPLDDCFGHQISASARDLLESAGYLGDYTLNSDGVCYRTQVAVRSQTLGIAAWTDFVAGRQIDNDQEKARTDFYIVSKILQVYFEETTEALRRLREMEHLLPLRPRQTLIQRWEQIQRLIGDAFDSDITGSTQRELRGRFSIINGKK